MLKLKYVFIVKWSLDNFNFSLITSHNRSAFQGGPTEQRHLTTGYKNRIRYRLNAVIPINHPETSPKTLYAYIGDEIFIGFTAPFYERNRFYAGLGYKVSQVFTIQSGYIRQYDDKITSELSRHFLQTALFINLNPEDFHKHSVPSTSD